MTTVLTSRHPALPGLIALGGFALWSLFWFVMAGRIEGEIDRWVERQADHGTDVTYTSLDVSGYPFRLVATFDAPRIVSRDDPSAFTWEGDRLRIITQAWNIRHIIIELLGNQTVAWVDAPQDGSRSPSRVGVDFAGKQLRSSLKLGGGRIKSIDTEFLDVVADITGDGGFGFLPGLPEHVELAMVEYHSRLGKTFDGGRQLTTRDVVLFVEQISDGKPSEEGDDAIEEILVAFSEELTGKSALHSGDIGGNRPAAPAQRITIHEAHVFRQPMSIRLAGDLRRPESRDFDGKVKLYLKGHEDLVRTMAEEEDVPDAAALVAGALFGILSMVSETNEAGELVIPLDIKDGDVYFGFLPLFSKDDYR